jgi:serine/threonine protein kinase
MLDQAASKAERGRFMREIQLTKRIKHKNVIGILDSGTTSQGLTYLVVPALAGKELRSYIDLDKVGLDREFACAIMEGVLEGMQAVHDASIVHRDLKPENCFVLAGGRDVKIMDFGLARLDDDALEATQNDYFRSQGGEVVGSPPYIAPESITSDPIDRRTDIYSLGVMFFEMLTGVRPIESETTQGYLTAHLVAPPLTLAEARPKLSWPPEAEKLIARMLAKSRDERPSTCRAILDELRTFIPKLVKAGPMENLVPETAVVQVVAKRSDTKQWGVKGLLGRLWGNTGET